MVVRKPVSSPPAVPVKKSLAEKFFPLLVVILVIMAFALGAMWSRLQSGGRSTTQTSGKYKSFEDAMKAIAKTVKVNDKKLLACLSGGGKKSITDADFRQGTELGVAGTPTFYINGKFLGGAYPYEMLKEVIDRELEGKGSTDCRTYSEGLQAECSRGFFNPGPKLVGVGQAPTRGGQNALVTIVEFSDFQCPFCARAKPTVDRILQEYGDRVTFVYKHFPLSQIHPRAQKAAEAAECARDEGKFWEFHDKLFETQADWANL